jgi:hypothetical protein
VAFKIPNPAHFVPRPYNVGADIGHIENIRPAGQSIGIALDRAASSEGGPRNPLSTDPLGNPSILKRLSFKNRMNLRPKLATPPKIKPVL